MKLIDQTPLYNEKGEITFMDRAKAMMQFGKSWLAEMEAQKSILPTFEKLLDKQYTLLRNVTPPELEAPIPFILVGPTGIFVLYVTPILGMFRAKGDQWGTIAGSAFRLEKINLMTRAERMARAVQLALQRQGFSELITVEPILLFTNPSVHVDSLRPIVRIVLRDALERFIISISQARVVLSPDMVFNVVNLIMNPPAPREETPSSPAEESAEAPWQESDIRMDHTQPAPGEDSLQPFTEPPSGNPFLDTAAPPAAAESWQTPPQEFTPLEDTRQVIPSARQKLPKPRQKKVTRMQWLFLALMAVAWCLLVVFFIYMVLQNI